jgi:hypothetical protein
LASNFSKPITSKTSDSLVTFAEEIMPHVKSRPVAPVKAAA